MVIFLYGKDAYRRREKLKDITGEYARKRGVTDFREIDCEENENFLVETVEFLRQASMFADSKFLVLKNADEIFGLEAGQVKEVKEIIKSFLENDNIFTLITSEDKPNKGFDFLLKKPVVFQEFQELNGEELRGFVLKKAQDVGLVFEPAASRFFTDYVSLFAEKTRASVNELMKISLAGFKSPIGTVDLKKMVNFVKIDESFQYVLKFCSARSFQERIFYLEILMTTKKEPRYVFNLLASLVRDRGDVDKLAELDVLIKSGLLDDEAALTTFALEASAA